MSKYLHKLQTIYLLTFRYMVYLIHKSTIFSACIIIIIIMI